MAKGEQFPIRVTRLSKSFKLPHERNNSLKSKLINFKRGRSFEVQKALDDISFEVKPGEFFGIIGRNGSGKSTLLKLLAGIYEPTSGKIEVNGKLTPFIELGVGFNPELTGRENVFLNGALLGFTRKQMAAMYDDIVSFAELERFMDQKLKNYSSGMHVRLAFSIAIQAKSDILLIDEVLAVGDLAFQEKCYKFFEDIKKSETTVVFISHDGSAIERFCDRVAIVDKGELVAIGKPRDMVLKYGAIIAGEQYGSDKEGSARHQGSGATVITKAQIFDSNDKSSASLKFGEPFSIEVHYELRGDPIEKAVFGIDVIDDQGISILGPNTMAIKDKDIIIKQDGRVRVHFPSNPLSPKTYTVAAGIFNHNASFAYDLVERVTTFKIIGKAQHGKVYIEPRWSFAEDSRRR